MRIFSKDLQYEQTDNKLYLIKDGILQNDTYVYKISSASKITAETENNYFKIMCPQWSDMYIMNDTIELSNYSTIYIEVDSSGTLGSYVSLNFFDGALVGNLVQGYRGAILPKIIFSEQLGTQINEKINYISNTAASNSVALRIYNMWLE